MATTRDPAGQPVLSFWKRLALAIRVLFDPALAARLLPGAAPPPLPAGPPAAPEPPGPATRDADRVDGALTLLTLLQAEGRLVDFLEQDVATFGDADIGAAARVVHEGCRKTLRAHVDLTRVRGEAEGSSVTLEPGFPAASIRLMGDIRGEPPYRGVLRHAGWRAVAVRLPSSVAGHDAHVLAAAEVEL